MPAFRSDIFPTRLLATIPSTLLILPCVLYVLPSASLFLTTLTIFVKSTNHETPHCTVFFVFLLPLTSFIQIFPSAPYSHTPTASVRQFVSNSYKVQVKLTILCVLVKFYVSISRRESSLTNRSDFPTLQSAPCLVSRVISRWQRRLIHKCCRAAAFPGMLRKIKISIRIQVFR